MTELEKKAIDVIRNHSHKLIDNFTQEDLENREISIFLAGYHEANKANEWHNINDTEPSKEQLGKQLLIRIESVIGDTDYDYLVYKYKGESITDVAGVLAWKEIK